MCDGNKHRRKTNVDIDSSCSNCFILSSAKSSAKSSSKKKSKIFIKLITLEFRGDTYEWPIQETIHTEERPRQELCFGLIKPPYVIHYILPILVCDLQHRKNGIWKPIAAIINRWVIITYFIFVLL